MENIIILDFERRYFPTSNKLIKRIYECLENKYLQITRNFFILPIIKKYVREEQTRIFAADKETETWLTENHLPFLRLDCYLTEKEYAEQEKKSLQFTRSMKQILPEIDFVYGGKSLWETEELNLYEAFFSPAVHNIENILKIIEQEKANKIILLDNSTKLGIIQKQFSHQIVVLDKTNFMSEIKFFLFKLFLPLAIKTISLFSSYKKINPHKIVGKKFTEIIFLEGRRGVAVCKNFLDKIKDRVTVFHEEKISYFEHFSPKEYFTEETRQKMSLLKLQLQKQKREIKNNKVITAKIKEKLAYKNIGLYPYFVEGLEYLFEVSYLKNALYYECFNNFLSENEPKLIIILGEGHSHHHLAFYLTKKNGKKVQFLFAMHGSFGDYPLYENLFSDKIALYGRHYGELLVKMKNSPNKMVVTGNPAWDYLATKKINLNNFGDKKIILLAATNMPNERDYLANLVISTLARLPEYQLIIKLHPEEETIYYERLLQKYKIKAEIFTEQLHSLILISSVVITAYSTVGLESLLLNKPVIDVNLTNKPFYQDYVEKGVALGIRKEEDLLPAIKSILEDETVRQKLEKNRKKYIYEHAYKQDGKAAERVVKLINSMLKEVDREN